MNSRCLFCIAVSVTLNAQRKFLSFKLDKLSVTIAYIKIKPTYKTAK